MNITITMSI